MKIAVCDMCGSEGRLYSTDVEGTRLNVCQNCSKFGKVVRNVHDKKFLEKIEKKWEKERKSRPLLSKEELVQSVVEDYAELIKAKRESLGMKQEDFAKKINEKESIIHKIETGHFEPSIKLARKIERFLRIKLIEQQSSEEVKMEKTQSGSFTLGDFIKTKK